MDAAEDKFPKDEKRGIECVYISNGDLYKHQWNVIEAIHQLRCLHLNVNLHLVGGAEPRSEKKIKSAIMKFDPHSKFVKLTGFVSHNMVQEIIENSDIFVFASSCENMPNTLLEGMRSHVPIACSDRGPMPEVLGRGGVYFNPENPSSISQAIETIIFNKSTRKKIVRSAAENVLSFSWQRCARETWLHIFEILAGNKKSK